MIVRWIIALMCALAVISGRTTADDAVVKDLLKLQRKSPDGVVFLDGPAFQKYLGGRSRPYAVIVFANAVHLLQKPQLRLADLRTEFGYLAKSYRSDAGTLGKVFFVEIEFTKSAEVFARLNTKSLPYVFCINPTFSTEGSGVLRVPSTRTMQPQNYAAYPWTAHDMAGFVVETTSIKAARIVRPSLFTHWTFPILVLTVLAVGSAVGLKLYYAQFMKNHAIWAFAILAVYMFSVSGGMHNIIRGVPFQHVNRGTGKVVMFLQTAQSQLGAEGFIMGTLYTSSGLLIAALTHFVPLLPKGGQKPVSLVIILAGLFCYYKIRSVYTWKTGFNPVWYI